MRLVTYPDERLKKTCMPVTCFDSSLNVLIQNMLKTMHLKRGVGLAAPQIGVNKRILVMDSSAGSDHKEINVLINPKITWSSPEVEIFTEGCLSIPGAMIDIIRPAAVEIEYQDYTGKNHNCTFTGFKARIAQHEIDHLEGVLMLDRISHDEHRVVYNKFQKMAIGNHLYG
jgi:peptide deformylase